MRALGVLILSAVFIGLFVFSAAGQWRLAAVAWAVSLVLVGLIGLGVALVTGDLP